MKITQQELEGIIKEEIAAVIEDGMFPKLRAKAKDTFSGVPGSINRPSRDRVKAWKQIGGEIDTRKEFEIAEFHKLADLKIDLKDYIANIRYAKQNNRLGDKILSLVDALALAGRVGSSRGHIKGSKRKPPQFTRESIASLEEMIDEEIEALMAEDDDWIQKAVDPDHEGYCTPMTKSTCTPARKALAKRFKKAAKKKEKKGGTGWQGKV